MDELERLSLLIKSSSQIVAFTGAGVSTESNIPDFRSSGGVYESIQRDYGEPPEVLLSHEFFMTKPAIFFEYLKKYLVFPKAMPNAAHQSLSALEHIGKLRAVVTQNIDGLHTKAGSKKVYELHGSIYKNYCMKCGERYGFDYVLSSDGVPHCGRCGGIVRPDVVLYGEQLNSKTYEGAVRAISGADLMLVMGTSLAVYPAAGLIEYFEGGDLVLINKTATPYDKRARLLINGAVGETMEQAMRLAGV